MEMKTAHLGTIQYEENNIIVFEDGIPGFEDEKDFIIVLSNDPELPFHYLQSVKREGVSFMITNPFIFVNPYDFELTSEVVEQLEIKKPSDISVYSIVTIPEDLERTSINLVAPVVVNNTNNKAKQVVLQDYPIFKYFIFKADGKDEV
ncbi:MAG: flagellar assembly factor FliW [Clostridiales bacterium]|jgi:flagellar assembly factor FliW|nr:flagellar assembly factor FliW [Clostridiales bacterium]MDN5297952.1 flagellar assembly factor FliW [Clostridiales bacterium]